MKVLIVGNGFDRAHRLPTNYADFLNIALLTRGVMVTWADDAPSIYRYDMSDEMFKAITEFASTVGRKQYEKFKNIVKECFWIEHFEVVKDAIGEKWLNFEDELYNVMLLSYNDVQKSASDSTTKIILSNGLLKRYFNKPVFSGKEVFAYLYEEHEKLLSALEIYMGEYIDKCNVDKVSIFMNNKYDSVLNYNYTSIYGANYPHMANEYCNIHGKADGSSKNLVLGYEDYYLPNKALIPELIGIEKFYQRIVKKTDNKYLKWLSQMEEDAHHGKENVVEIFGHSLSPVDGDIIKKFIEMNNTISRIYCHTIDDRAEIIKNLSIILGRDRMIELAGGTTPCIQFLVEGADYSL